MADIIAKYMYPILKALAAFPTYEEDILLEDIDKVLSTVVNSTPSVENDITVASVRDVRIVLASVVKGLTNTEDATEYIQYKVVQGHTPAKAKGVINIYYAPGSEPTHYFGKSNKNVFKPNVRITITGINYSSGLHAALFIKETFKTNKLAEDGSAGVFLDGDINYLGYNEEGCPEFELDYKTIIVN